MDVVSIIIQKTPLIHGKMCFFIVIGEEMAIMVTIMVTFFG